MCRSIDVVSFLWIVNSVYKIAYKRNYLILKYKICYLHLYYFLCEFVYNKFPVNYVY